MNIAVELPYYVLSPGQTTPVNKFVSVPPEHEIKPQGEVMLTTVGLLRAHPLDIVWAWATPGTQIEKKKEVLGDSTPAQFNEQSARQMDGSQMAAIYVALQRAGHDVTIRGNGARIEEVREGSPAHGKLNPGDIILAVNNEPVQFSSDVTRMVRANPIGANLSLKIRNTSGVERVVEVTTSANPQSPDTAYLGVGVSTENLNLDTPFPVSFKKTEIGGPSAGLAFALALIDTLTPGELTGGGKVATTGTLSADGRVGVIGGIEQKTRSVRKSGAKLFLVPAAEAEDARKYAGSNLKVVGVETLEQAITALRENGGDTSGLPATVNLKPLP